MKETRCKAVNPCEEIVITNPSGMNRFVVRDEEIENRVEEVYSHYVVGTESTVLITCRDEKNERFASIIIEEDGSRWLHFDDPSNKYVPCTRSQFRAVIGCSAWCRMWIRMLFDEKKDLVNRDIYCDIVGEFYYDDYIRECKY